MWDFRYYHGEYFVHEKGMPHRVHFNIVFHHVVLTRGEPENIRRQEIVRAIVEQHNAAVVKE